VRLPAAQAVWLVRPARAAPAPAVVVDVADRRGRVAGVARAARRAGALPERADPAERREQRVPQAGREVQVALAAAARPAAVGAAARRAEVTRAARAACPGLAAGQGANPPRPAAIRVS
jgi:hypothetical protein